MGKRGKINIRMTPEGSIHLESSRVTMSAFAASIAATGLALASYPVAVERGFITRAAAAERTLATLRFFWYSPQGPEPDATGYRGFYYHFLDMQTGRRAWQCELSTIDSTFLLAGALTAGAYFDADTADEDEIRRLADTLYRIRDRGVTIIIVEHDMGLVMEVSDEIVVLDRGAKIAEGPPRLIQKDPAVVEAYLGESDAEEVAP